MIALALLLAAQSPVAEPPPAPPAVTQIAPVDPERLKAARALVDQVMPPQQRDAMMQAMVKPMLGNIRQAIFQNPEFTKLGGDDPRVNALLQSFTEKLLADAMGNLSRSMPRLMDAMAIAYARQFTVSQLNEVRGFYASPTGRVFVTKQPAIIADPAVLEAQRAMMTEQMAQMPDRLREFTAELKKIAAEKGASK